MYTQRQWGESWWCHMTSSEQAVYVEKSLALDMFAKAWWAILKIICQTNIIHTTPDNNDWIQERLVSLVICNAVGIPQLNCWRYGIWPPMQCRRQLWQRRIPFLRLELWHMKRISWHMEVSSILGTEVPFSGLSLMGRLSHWVHCLGGGSPRSYSNHFGNKNQLV